MTEPQPARVGVNLTWLVPGVVGGSEESTIRTLRALSELEPADVAVTLYLRGALLEHYPDLAWRFATEVMPEPPAGWLGTLGAKAVRVGLEQSWLAARSADQHLVHHAGGAMPFVRRSPGIVTVHDLQPFEMPENFSTIKVRWLNTVVKPSLSAARLVVCPSRYTADRVAELFGIDPAKLAVVPHGFDGFEANPAVDGSARLPPELEGRRFLLVPAITYRHKRHGDVIDALAHLPADAADVLLVLTGGEGPYHRAVRANIVARGLTDRVLHLGRVSVGQLAVLYRDAAALVFPSAYEGFGNPCLEAMWSGCPVIASDATSLPEIVGDAGLLYPVGSVPRLVEAVVRVLREEGLVRELIVRGQTRAERFSTGASALALIDSYRHALGPSRTGPARSVPAGAAGNRTT